MREKLKNWKFCMIVALSILLLSCLFFLLRMETLWFPWWLVLITRILFFASLVRFIWIRTKKDGIKKILSLLVCSSALTITFYLLRNYYGYGYGVYKERERCNSFFMFAGITTCLSVIALLLLIIWKEPKKNNKK